MRKMKSTISITAHDEKKIEVLPFAKILGNYSTEGNQQKQPIR